jgi:hypothetical protein
MVTHDQADGVFVLTRPAAQRRITGRRQLRSSALDQGDHTAQPAPAKWPILTVSPAPVNGRSDSNLRAPAGPGTSDWRRSHKPANHQVIWRAPICRRWRVLRLPKRARLRPGAAGVAESGRPNWCSRKDLLRHPPRGTRIAPPSAWIERETRTPSCQRSSETASFWTVDVKKASTGAELRRRS